MVRSRPNHVNADHARRVAATTTTTTALRMVGNNRNENSGNSNNTRGRNFLDFLSPYETKIPIELREEIYRAEANTEAARDRGKRVALYGTLAVVGILLALLNGVVTELRQDGGAIVGSPADDVTAAAAAAAAGMVADGSGGGDLADVLAEAGFGWVTSNPLYYFLFTNKIGGGMCLLLGGGAALMAESEMDTKRLNAEKIYEELERRRNQKLASTRARRGPGGGDSSSKARAVASDDAATRKKKRPGREKKRLGALSEVAMPDVHDGTAAAAARDATSTESTTVTVAVQQRPGADAVEGNTEPGKESFGDDSGLFGQIRTLYEKADSMAASQALLLNKKLEEAGVVEKITDESGLRVVGREAAVKQQEAESKEKTPQKQDS
jgi:hypothetical protein